jgi:hypothetical protein
MPVLGWKENGTRGSCIVARDAASGTARDMFRGGEREAGNPNRSGRTYHDDSKIVVSARA